MTTVADLLLHRDRLKAVSDSATADIELLLCYCIQKPRSYLRAWPEAVLSPAIEQQFLQLLSRRLQGEPIAYLIGERGFWTLDLQVSPATLIPRPETELLVEIVLSRLQSAVKARVLDLGTGTGAIALALASERADWQLLASDVSEEAVLLAEANRAALGLDNVSIQQSDWFTAIAPGRFDAIVSNPPYIDPQDPHLHRGDIRFEPRSALVADNQGMADIEKIVAKAPNYLADAGWLLFEHGYDQGDKARALLAAAGFQQVFTEQDLAGQDRVSGGRWTQGNGVK
ncbi:MAG: peptide chain release factor N(5)-glutamine methyltransferase [Spongiibacteraceae bacterium]